MAQKSYLAKRQIYFSIGATYVRPGDILTYEESVSRMTIFRGGVLVGSVRQTATGIKSLLAQKVPLIEEIKPTPVAPVVVKEEPKVDPAVPERYIGHEAEYLADTQRAQTMDPVVVPVPVEKPIVLADLTKAKIAAHAKTFGLEIDPEAYTKIDLIARVEKHKESLNNLPTIADDTSQTDS
jgi:hypothetical protein